MSVNAASCIFEYTVHVCLTVNTNDGKTPGQNTHATRNVRILHKNKKETESIVTSTLLFSKHLVWSSCIQILDATKLSYKSFKLQKFGDRILEYTVRMSLTVNVNHGKTARPQKHANRNIRLLDNDKEDRESIATSSLLLSKRAVALLL
jgi:hypothetical protein